MRRTIVMGLLLANVTFGLDAVLFPQAKSDPNGDFSIGVHLMMTGAYTSFPQFLWGEHLRYARQMTGAQGWVAQVIQSNDLHPEKWQAFLDDCFALNLRPVLRLASPLDPHTGFWSKPRTDKYGGYAEIAGKWADFFTRLRLPNPVWVVVGNEPNSGGEWGGEADPAEYARYFVAVAEALHSLDQPLKVAAAGLNLYAPNTNGLPFPHTQETMMDAAAFLDGMFVARPRWMDQVDFWASHVYPLGPFMGAPWEKDYHFDRIQGAERLPLINPPDGIYNRGINGYEWEKWYLKNVWGVRMPPILVTEMGYRHKESVHEGASDTLGIDLDALTAARFTAMAIWGNHGQYADAPKVGWTPLADDPKIMGVIYFALAGDPKSWGHSNLLQVDEGGRVIGTYPIYDVLLEQGSQ